MHRVELGGRKCSSPDAGGDLSAHMDFGKAVRPGRAGGTLLLLHRVLA
jgi:hypothetical protein